MSFIKKEFSFPSTSGLADIHCASYLPENGEVKAVMQIAHGMAEHLERYEKFISYEKKQLFLKKLRIIERIIPRINPQRLNRAVSISNNTPRNLKAYPSSLLG